MGILPFRIPVMSTFLKRIPAICDAEVNGRILKPDHNGRIYVLRRHGQLGGVRLVSVLSELKVGDTCVVETLELPESVQNYLMHLGFLPNALVTVLRRAPAGDPTVYGVDGIEIALRHETASAIHVRHPEDPASAAPPPESAIPDPDAAALRRIAASVEPMEVGHGVAR